MKKLILGIVLSVATLAFSSAVVLADEGEFNFGEEP